MVNEQTHIEMPAASADGKRNAYTHRCRIVQQSRPYAGCLARCSGELRGDTECSAAIASTLCPALGMREQEALQGRAIYFKARTVAPAEPARAWVMPDGKRTGPARSAPAAPTHSPEPLLGTMPSYADVVNRIAQRDANARRAKSIVLQPGESPLAALRRSQQANS